MSFGKSTSTQPVDMVTAEFLSVIFPDDGFFTTDQYFKYKPFTKLDSDEPQYYAICAVKDGADGTKSRKNENFKSLNVLVCDDVGTKAAIPPLPPSYIIETSLGNFQYGYILDKPETDFVKANRLVTNLVKSGYSDPGASGIVRLVRLPAGINIKPQHNGFKVERTEWHPDRRYTYKELLNMLSPNVIHLSKNSEPYEVPEEIIKGNRNTQMTQLFGHYHSELGAEGAIIKICSYNKEHCKPPLDDKELKAVIDSISRREAEKEEKLESAKKDLLENIYFLKEPNMYCDIRDMSIVNSNSLDKTYLQSFPGGKSDVPKAATFLALSSESKSAVNFGWLPTEDRLIVCGGKVLLNTYSGFAVKPQEGNVQPWLDHLAHVVPEEDYRRALLWWFAYNIQHPAEKINWQPILLGVSGAGKDGLLKPIAKILGSAYKIVGNKDMAGDYDDCLYQTSLLHISEAAGLRGNAIEFYKRISANEATTERLLNIKCKGKVWQHEICNVLVITNNINAMKFDKDERRPFVLYAPEVMTESMKIAYFDEWLDRDGPAFLLDYLLKYDLSEFSPSRRPYNTSHFEDMFQVTRNDMERALDRLLNGEIIENNASDDDGEIVDDVVIVPGKYDLMEPSMLYAFIDMERSSESTVEKWLHDNGYRQYPGSFKIQRGIKCKPRSWRYKVGSKYDPAVRRQSPKEVFMAVEAIEKFFTKNTKF